MNVGTILSVIGTVYTIISLIFYLSRNYVKLINMLHIVYYTIS